MDIDSISVILSFNLKLLFTISNQPLHLQSAGLTRPAPAETPQGRNTARIGGCSGAL